MPEDGRGDEGDIPQEGMEEMSEAIEKILEDTRNLSSSSNYMIASKQVVRMMMRYMEYGDHYFNGPYGTMKGLRGLMDRNVGGVSEIEKAKMMLTRRG